MVECKFEKFVSDYLFSELESLLIKKGDDYSFIILGIVFILIVINFI